MRHREIGLLILVYLLSKGLRGLKGGDLTSRQLDGRILTNVTCGLGCPLLNDKTAEATQVDVLLIDHSLLDHIHSRLDRVHDELALDPGLLGNLIDKVCFYHNMLQIIWITTTLIPPRYSRHLCKEYAKIHLFTLFP